MSETMARDGHLLELGMERALAGELGPDSRAAIEAHAQACPDCARRWALAQERPELPPLRLSPALAQPDPSPEPANRGWIWALAALAAGALVGLGLRPVGGLEEERYTAKGAGLVLEVYRDAEGPDERLLDGASARPGDRIGFRVQSAEAGHLLVVGVDDRGQVYPCHPQGPAPAAARLEPQAGAVDLPAAVQLDPTLGVERIVALRCAEPFDLEELRPALIGLPPEGPVPALRAGCEQDIVRLHKGQP
jgi:hypothetical protein